jgi:RHS repeat-associated protein
MATTIARALASAIQIADSGFLTATPSGNVILIASTGTGAATDWTISAGTSYDTANFTSPSYSLSSSGMSGGKNATYQETNAYSFSIASSGGYDGVGNVKSVSDSSIGNWTYTYDTLNRLLTGNATSGNYSGYYGCWAYDSFGNRTAENYQNTTCQTPETSVTPTARYNAANQVTWTSVNGAVNGFTYDAAGNVLNDNSNTYLYDAEGRLCAVKNASGIITEYVYDAEGRRVAKGTLSSWPSACVAPTAANGFTLNTTYVLGLGGEQVSEISVSGSTGTWAHTNVFAEGKLLATYNGTDTYFALNDWLGTKRAEYTPDGLLSTFFSLPYGNGLSTSGNAADPTEHHFTGKERDSESGLDYFGARHYGSSLGRFMQVDPKQFSLRTLVNPQKWNKYVYVLNNPLALIDPNGMEEVTIQVNAFIQKNSVGGFRGDNRGFSSNMKTGAEHSRVSVTMRIETDPAKNHGNPLISKPEVHVGTTHLNMTGSEKTSTGPTMPEVTATQDKNGNVNVNLQESMRNPFTPLGTGSIQTDLNISVNQNATNAEVSGSLSGSPSFETNFSVDGGASENLPLQTEPSSALGFMLGLQQTNNVDQRVDLPRPKCSDKDHCSQ